MIYCPMLELWGRISFSAISAFGTSDVWNHHIFLIASWITQNPWWHGPDCQTGGLVTLEHRRCLSVWNILFRASKPWAVLSPSLSTPSFAHWNKTSILENPAVQLAVWTGFSPHDRDPPPSPPLPPTLFNRHKSLPPHVDAFWSASMDGVNSIFLHKSDWTKGTQENVGIIYTFSLYYHQKP